MTLKNSLFRTFNYIFILNNILVVCKRILGNSIKLDGNACTKPPKHPAINWCDNEIVLPLSRSDPNKRRQYEYEP